MKRFFNLPVIILVILSASVSCNSSKKDDSEKLNKEIASEKAKILVNYTKAKAVFQTELNERLEYTKATGISLSKLSGHNWKDNLWKKAKIQFGSDSIFDAFTKKYGEDESNLLLLEINKLLKD